MALENVHNNEMSLVLSSDAKPRLKWTPELHQRFADAVNQLGGAEKATPKSLMRIMGIHGLTLYHLKSHLQKYRLGKSQQPHTCHQNKHEDDNENHTSQSNKIHVAEKQINESLQVTQALQMQMEVQKKLHEQIEVQRHLQLRIAAQGKYLQSVLRKAQETLSEYSACSIEVEHAKSQLSQLVSMVDSECPSSSFSVLTQSDGLALKDIERDKLLGHNRYSLESSLTSSGSSGRNEQTRNEEVDVLYKHEDRKSVKGKRNSIMLPLMEMNPSKTNDPEDKGRNRKRSKSSNEENIDLNRQSLNEFDSGPNVIDLNSDALQLFTANF